MAIKYDQHVHSTFSGDANGEMEDLIKEAIEKGMEGLTFTEHNDIGYPYTYEEDGIYDLNTDSYLYELLCMREKYGDKLKLGFGVELGMNSEKVADNVKYASSFPFDFIIFSCHIVNGKDPFYPEDYWDGRDEEEAVREYFTYILDNIKAFDNFDVLGHLDYVIRYAPQKDNNYSYEKYKDLLDAILETLIKKGKGLEINTKGYASKGCRDVHPFNDVLKRYHELGGRIVTVGSDTHAAGSLGNSFEKAEEALRKAGFDYYCSFENRVAVCHKL